MRKLTLLITVMVTLVLLASCTMAVDPNFQVQQPSDQVEPGAGQWQTWVLASSDELRPAAPPDQAATMVEIAELKAMAHDADTEAIVAYWDAGTPSYRWVQIALSQFNSKNPGNGRIFRGMSLMNVAIYDATVAAWDAKYTYNRARPSDVDSSLATLVAVPNSPSYPSEHAVAAGAAAAVLSYLYPDDAQMFEDKAEEAANSRLLAGVQYPSDVEAGLALGRQVAEQVIARAMADGSDAVWDKTLAPTEATSWTHENPYEVLAGSWQGWVIESGDQFRPDAPYANDSPEMLAEIAEVKAITHTWQLDGRAAYWHSFGSTIAWYDFASREIFERHLDTNAPEAARIYAMMSVATSDAFIGCWEAKYTYWAMRPYQIDTEVKSLLPFPPHPTYPSGHSCVSTAVTNVLAHVFPDEADYVRGLAEEAGFSRMVAGIHVRNDLVAGAAIGQGVAELVIERAEAMMPSSAVAIK
jgi:membrane-associated phospholipid phosphatase